MFLIHINANASNGHDDGICSVSGFSFAENFLNFYSAPELCVGHKMTFFNHKIVLYVANQSQRKSMLPNRIKIPSLVPPHSCMNCAYSWQNTVDFLESDR